MDLPEPRNRRAGRKFGDKNACLRSRRSAGRSVPRALCAPSIVLPTSLSVAFLAENQAAMTKMMNDMAVMPTRFIFIARLWCGCVIDPPAAGAWCEASCAEATVSEPEDQCDPHDARALRLPGCNLPHAGRRSLAARARLRPRHAGKAASRKLLIEQRARGLPIDFGGRQRPADARRRTDDKRAWRRDEFRRDERPAPTIESSPMSAPSRITALMPTRPLRRMMHPCSTAP